MAFDLDGVLLDCKSSWEWIHNHFSVSNEDSHALFKAGKIDDLEFIRRDVMLWEKALGRKVCTTDIMPIIEKIPIRKGVTEVLNTLKSKGYVVGIISGGLRPAVEKIASMVDGGLDFAYSNWLETDAQGNFTGVGIIGVKLREKGLILAAEQSRWQISKENTVSVGDSYVDISMFEISGISIAFNPQSEDVAERAKYVVYSRDLRAILKYIP